VQKSRQNRTAASSVAAVRFNSGVRPRRTCAPVEAVTRLLFKTPGRGSPFQWPARMPMALPRNPQLSASWRRCLCTGM
jgi:hypothetical protein